MAFHGDSARKSQRTLEFGSASTPPRAATLREKLRELIYGSGKQKSVAIECYGASGQSRLTRALSHEHEGDVSLDIDLLIPVLRELGDDAAGEAITWLAAEFGREVRKVQKLPVEERLAALEAESRADLEAAAEIAERRRLRAEAAASLRAELARKEDGLV